MVHNAVELAPLSEAYFLCLVPCISTLTLPSDLIEVWYSMDLAGTGNDLSSVDINYLSK